MENAARAFIMAGEILIAVMIVSIGVYIFDQFALYSEDRYTKIEKTQIAEFNNDYLKFYGTRKDEDGNNIPIECTIHDIASLANLAKKHNEQYELRESDALYVRIDIGSSRNIEKYTNDRLVELIKGNDLINKWDASLRKYVYDTKYYKCITCTISNITDRVNYIKFQEI